MGFQVTHSRLWTPGTVGTWQKPYPSENNIQGQSTIAKCISLQSSSRPKKSSWRTWKCSFGHPCRPLQARWMLMGCDHFAKLPSWTQRTLTAKSRVRDLTWGWSTCVWPSWRPSSTFQALPRVSPHLQQRLPDGNPLAPTNSPMICTSAILFFLSSDVHKYGRGMVQPGDFGGRGWTWPRLFTGREFRKGVEILVTASMRKFCSL